MIAPAPPRLAPLLSPVERAAVHGATHVPSHVRVAGVGVRFDAALLVVWICASFSVGIGRAMLLVPLLVVSVLAVELARALVARRWNVSASIVVTPLGGLLVGAPAELSRPMRLVLGLFSPAAHLALAVLFGSLAQRAPALRWVYAAHLGCALLQSLPVAPFDGATVLDAWVPPSRPFVRLLIGLSAIGLAARVALSFLGPAIVIVPAALATASALRTFAEALAELKDRTGESGALLSIAHYEYEQDDPRSAARSAEQALRASEGVRYRLAAADALALALAATDPSSAERVLEEHVPVEVREPLTVAAIAHARGDHRGACTILLQARAAGERRRRSTRLLIDACIAAGNEEDALTIGIADAALLRTDDLAAISAFASEGGYDGAAAVLDALSTCRRATRAS